MNRFIGGMMALALLAGVAGTAAAADGAKLYQTKCAMCHGKAGEGNAGMAKAKKMDLALWAVNDADTLDKTDEELIKATEDGFGKNMMAFKGKMSDEEIAAVVAHIRTLAPKGDGKTEKKEMKEKKGK